MVSAYGQSLHHVLTNGELALFLVMADLEHYTPRLIFGCYEVYAGLPLASLAIGILAIIRRLSQMRRQVQSVVIIAKAGTNDNCWAKFANYWGCRCTMLRWAMIGTVLGALLGIGSTAVAFMSDANVKASSKDSEDFEKGSLIEIAATQPAASAVVGATLILLRSLGIPSRVAMIISSFTIHFL